jgi:hypothetical protein
MAVRLSALRSFRPLLPRKTPGTHFSQRFSRPQGRSAVGRIRKIEKCNNLIGNGTRDLSACCIVSQLTTLPRARHKNEYKCDYEGSEELQQQRKRKLRKTEMNLLLFSFRIHSRNVTQLDITVTGK